MEGNVDHLLETIADYVIDKQIMCEEAKETARLVLLDSLGCGFLALRYPECTKHLGPLVPGIVVKNGARVPGTSFELDPVQAAFNIGCMIRWLDYNDTWLAAEWGHPSDNLGGILATADYISRKQISEGKAPLTMGTVLDALIKAHEIQGILALENSLNRVGLDHVLFVKVASTAVVTSLLGGTKEAIINAVSNAWVDNSSLRTYRHKPNTGSRKSWAAGDATSRAVRLALMALKGEMGYPQALSAPKWGVKDVLFGGNEITIPQELSSYVMENILFKISYPAEFHAQTAAECAVTLHPIVHRRLDEIDRIVITTQESAIRIIDKKGPLYNPADRDHCIQYITAVGLVYGAITADHYEADIAANPIIDQLRSKMQVVEDEQYSRDYLDPEKRAIPNAVQVFFKDGTSTENVEVIYPIGHRFRRTEGVPLLYTKFEESVKTRFPARQLETIINLFKELDVLNNTPVNIFMDQFVI